MYVQLLSLLCKLEFGIILISYSHSFQKSSFITGFTQEGSGQDHSMEPLANHTQLERWTRDGKPYLEEYKGNNKLEGKAAIIAGGDSGIGRTVSPFAQHRRN